MIILLQALGSKIELFKKKKIIKITNIKKHKTLVPYKLISTMRSGVLLMGSLLGKYNKCTSAMSGGCSLGIRAINFHIEGFKKLDCRYSLNKGYINLEAKNGLKGNRYKFPKVTVTGTSNLLMASVLAKGTTILENISIEPEVIDLIKFLKNGGAKISFLGKRIIKIDGVKKLNGCTHEIIGDRIEAFSYLCAGAITRGKIRVKKVRPKHLNTELKVLKKIGCDLTIGKSSIYLNAKKKLKPIKIKTGVWPLFATDNMPILMSVLTKVIGKSEIIETIFSNRFMASPELERMGATIKLKDNKATIIGTENLMGAECIASDLRTTFSIILGAMAADKSSKISRIYHGKRGYSNLVQNLRSIGVNIRSIS